MYNNFQCFVNSNVLINNVGTKFIRYIRISDITESDCNFVFVLLQIGRSSENPIDFVVLDTVPGAKNAEDCVVTQSTISRFACRILVDRSPPYTARIYAAGFDSSLNIFLGVGTHYLQVKNFWSF